MIETGDLEVWITMVKITFQMGPRIERITVLIILMIRLRAIHGIIGYDCGSPKANFTTLSLLNIEDCDLPQHAVNSSRIFVQLLQTNEFHSVTVRQCKVEIDRTIKRCGMFSHTSDVLNGKYSYVEEVSREACSRMHAYGTYSLSNMFISGLRSNRTASRPAVLGGHVDNDGKCSGGAYSDPYGTWSDVVVLGTVKITLRDYTADINADTYRVKLRSGVTCAYNDGYCVDMEGGDTYWDNKPMDACGLEGFSVLYTGNSDKIYDGSEGRSDTIYSLTAQDTVFALTRKNNIEICGYALVQTDHPRLLIYEVQPGKEVFKKQTRIANLDLFTYMNSKFVYVEKHVRTQIQQLYRNVLLQQCAIEQQMLKNALSIATQSPDIFAYHLMKGPGYMALIAGEVIHIIKCVPVEVKLIHTRECFNQLPVEWGNETYYMTPQTHVLLRQGTQVTCNTFAPAMYLLGDTWYKFIPRPIESVPPVIMKPTTIPTWKYTNPGALATSGIYTQSELKDLRDHIMFPAERPAVLNTLARGIIGESASLNKGSFGNLLDEASIEKIAASAWSKFWDKFLIFGNISAGVIGIYLTVRIFKLALDTIIHGYALHTVYGWSMYLVGAIWDSLTQLLLHIGRKGNNKKQEPSAPPVETPDNQTLLTVENSSTKEETNAKCIYPSLPTQRNSTFTLELKE